MLIKYGDYVDVTNQVFTALIVNTDFHHALVLADLDPFGINIVDIIDIKAFADNLDYLALGQLCNIRLLFKRLQR